MAEHQERKKPLPFDNDLIDLIKRSMSSARANNHPYMNFGHLGLSLNNDRPGYLNSIGLNTEIFEDALPKEYNPGIKPVLSEDVKRFLDNASTRARVFGSKEVTVDHLIDAMTDPSMPLIMIFKFSRHTYPIEVRRSSNREAAA